MKVHPATQFKNQHRKIEISEEDIPPSQPVGGVGRRTGQTFENLNKNKQARKIYEYVLTLDSNNYMAKAALRRVPACRH